MVQMTIDPFVNIRAMRELLEKVLLDKKDVDMHIINNVMISTCQKKLELDSANIQIDPKKLDTTFLIHIWTQLTIILKVNNYCISIFLSNVLFVLKLYVCCFFW